jgi:hypothetical protein
MDSGFNVEYIAGGFKLIFGELITNFRLFLLYSFYSNQFNLTGQK